MLRATLLAGTCLAVLGACAQNMVAGEYWVDTDPGWGQGVAINGMPVQAEVSGHLFQVPTGSLPVGMHLIGMRTKDANGRWSLTNVTPVHINAAPQTAEIARTVYFWNTDAGWGSGTDAGIDGDPQVNGTVTASLAGTTPGINTLFVRSQDASGQWGITNTTPVYVAVPDMDAPIVRTEYFLNADPGWGLGTDADVDGQPDVSGVASASSDDAMPGINTLYVRSKDAHGHWSLTSHMLLYMEAAPSGEIVAAESFWDMDPGFGMGEPVPDWTPGADVSGQFQVMVPIDIGLGHHKLYVRTRDSHGHWSLTNWQMDSVNVDGTTDVNDLATRTGISTYPNPFTEGISVRTDDDQPLRVVLYDPQGRLVHDKLLTGETYIDLHGLASGTYTAFFWRERERIHRVQLVKP